MAGTIKIGVAGWSYKDWEGIVYPASLKSAGKLGYMAAYFDMVEINTSFYGPIRPDVGGMVPDRGTGESEFSVHGQAVSRVYAFAGRGRANVGR